MKLKRIMRVPCVIVLLAFHCSIVFGQIHGGPIRPVRREVVGADTFTVFTLADERAIVYHLTQGIIQGERVALLERYAAGCDSARAIGDSLARIHAERDSTADAMIAGQAEIITRTEAVVKLADKAARRYRRQRNGAIVGGVLLSLLFLGL